MEEEPPNLNNNPHLRGANARFLSGGENPRLYWEQASEASRVLPEQGFGEQDPSTIPVVESYQHVMTQHAREGHVEAARLAQETSRAIHPTVDLTGPPPVHTVTLDANRLPVVDLTHGVWYS